MSADSYGEPFTVQRLRAMVATLPSNIREHSTTEWAADEIDSLRAELAALKARRCDGCAWYVPDPAFMSPESAFGTCAMPHSGPTPEPPVSLYMDGEPIRVDVLVDADHACNAWEARSDG